MSVISNFISKFVNWINKKVMERKKRKEKKEPSYMLFVFGNFIEHENLATDISGQFLPIVTSKFLKFTYGEFGIVFHFRSKEIFSELKEYVDMVMEVITDQYFLFEVPKNMDIKMDKRLKKDFLSIDEGRSSGEEKNKSSTIDLEKIIENRRNELKNFTFDFILPIVETEDFFKKIEQDPPPPTIDEILDKITDKGIESLTEKEKQILDNYGKDENGRN